MQGAQKAFAKLTQTCEVSHSARERRAACNGMNEKPKAAKLQARGAVGCTDFVRPHQNLHHFFLGVFHSS
jgi:hypothetical protein